MTLPSVHAPKAMPLPPARETDWLPEESWDMMWKLTDALLPSITSESHVIDRDRQVVLSDEEFEKAIDQAYKGFGSSTQRKDVQEYLSQRISRDAEFRRDVETTLSTSPQRDKLAGALKFLRSRLGSLFMGYCWTPLDQQPAEALESVLRGWRTSNTQMPRMLLKIMNTIVQKANSVNNQMLHEIAGYPQVPKEWKPVQGHDYGFVQIPVGEGEHVIETDVVVVGSGPGGGVSAKNIAEAGYKVLVVDKAYHFPPSQLPMPQAAAIEYLFDNSGPYITEDSSLNTIAGSSWGGGGTVNWSVSLRTPTFVRQEWADGGLHVFATPAFDQHLNRVTKLIGAGTDNIRHNHANRVLLDSCEKLGWKAKVAPQNTDGKEHYCGHCHLGCGSGEKRGPAISMLPAAADAGALFMEGFEVEKVVFAEDGKTAVGVKGRWTSRGPNGEVHLPVTERIQRDCFIKAKRVVISGGSLWSPVLLKKSGVENPQVGKNLHLHPVNNVAAAYKHRTDPWEGGIITSYCDEFANLDGKGHGVTLEPNCMVPLLPFAQQSWDNGLDAKIWQLKYAHMNVYISLTRDRDSGEVFVDPVTGRPRINYTISDFDREHTLDGVQALAKMCYVAGATEIRTTAMGLEPFVVTTPQTGHVREDGKTCTDPEYYDPKFAAWLLRLRQLSNAPPVGTFGSAHQMGSCRMSASENTGVVDSQGRVWGTKGLYVADSSVLPSATGVNPMLTTLAVSDMISRWIIKDLEEA